MNVIFLQIMEHAPEIVSIFLSTGRFHFPRRGNFKGEPETHIRGRVSSEESKRSVKRDEAALSPTSSLER